MEETFPTLTRYDNKLCEPSPSVGLLCRRQPNLGDYLVPQTEALCRSGYTLDSSTLLVAR